MKLHLLQLPKLIAENRSSAIFGVLIIVMLWTGAFVKYSQDVNSDLKDAQRTSQSFAMVFEENVLRSIDELDSLLFYLRRNIEERKDWSDYNSILHSTDIPGDIIVQVSIIDAQGIMRASSAGPQPAPPTNLSDRRHFKVHVNSKEDKLFISKPLIGRISNKWSVQLSRRFLNADGTFGGVVVASLDPEHFTNFYNKIDLASSASIALIGDDGVVRSAGGQSGAFKMGEDVRGTDLFARMQRDVNSNFEEADPTSGRTGLVALRKVRDRPLWVSVALDKDEVLAGSYSDLRMDCVAAMLLSLVILAAMELIFRTETGARQKSKQLELTLESMSQGIMLVTKDLTIPIINKKCAELLKLPPAFIENPPRFDRMGEYGNLHLFNAGTEADTPHCDWFDPTLGQEHLPIAEWTMGDGTVLEVRNGQLPDGGFVRTFTDITKRVQAEAHIARLASEDSLTGLLNRRGFRAALVELQSERQASGRMPDEVEYAVLFLDLDRFKVINDTLGHRIGDLLLQETARRVRASLRSIDVLARLGGDEFAVIARHVKTRSALDDLAHSLINAIREPFELEGYRIRTTISIGVAVSPTDGEDADDLVVAADLALYAAKERNRDCFHFYHVSMTKELTDRRQNEVDLREAIENNELELFYQPIVSLRDNKVVSFEALARWNHRTRGFVPPSEFIPVAEDTGMIARLGEWALNEACSKIARLPAETSLAVNLSPVQFSSDLVDVVQRALSASGLAPHRLELEITERLLLENNDHILSILGRLRQLGVRIALDDFGTGYSALSYLRKFPLDKIKIDRSFVSDIGTRSEQVAIIQAVLSIARALGMTVTAEGVETGIQKDFLQALGCDSAQGYLFGKPARFEEVAEIIASGASRKIMAA